jgi:hypothetical protein
MNKRSANKFQRNVEVRQRNVVFPNPVPDQDTMLRNLITSKKPLSVLHVVGFSVLYLSVLSLLFITGYFAFEQFLGTSGSGVNRIVAGFGPWVIVLMLCGVVFLLLRWRIRKALVGAHQRPPLAK